MVTDTEIVQAVNDILSDYLYTNLTAHVALGKIARCVLLRDVSR